MCTVFASEHRIPDEVLKKCLEKTRTRGPDGERIETAGAGNIAFQRLTIMGVSEAGMQPFSLGDDKVVCNGEIYGFRPIRAELVTRGYSFNSTSDCEVLLPLYREFGVKMFGLLDAEFACVIYDGKEDRFIVARDPIGIRPLFYCKQADGSMVFASEPKNLVEVAAGAITPFPPGYYYVSGKDGKEGTFTQYYDPGAVTRILQDDVDEAGDKIRRLLVKAVSKRLDSDMPVGYLLSGGLDSSLVCSIAQRLSDKPLRTFAVGMDVRPIDLKYARETAEYLGTDHTEVIMTRDQVIGVLPELIKALGTWDITTIRASVGMYLLCKYIHENTDIRVLLTGEVSDELFGYKYTDFAPTPADFQKEAQKRVRELHYYDVLRADRCISVNSLEARVPFGDLAFADYVMSLDPAVKVNTYGKGKYLLRHAFDRAGFLPQEILFREKAAFSDAVGHSMVDEIKEYAESKYTDSEFAAKAAKYTYRPPFTKESLLYREIFEENYPGQAEMIPDFWMPNKTWPGLAEVNDPSARVLSNYGASGE